MNFDPICNLIPHKMPMQLVDELVEVAEQSAVARARITENHLFLREDNTLAPEALCEMVAQCFAAGEGQRRKWAGKSLEGGGFLASVRDFEFLAPVHAGDELIVSATLTDVCFGTHLVQGKVFCQGREMARGVVYIFMWEGKALPAQV